MRLILDSNEKQELLSRFPLLELSYDNKLHKKVYSDIYIIIPCGIKSFVWFTYWKEKNVCFVLTLNRNGNVIDVQGYPCCFNTQLAYGTILYGTLFDVKGIKHFSCEDIFYSKGLDISKFNYKNKLDILGKMFNTKDIVQKILNKSFLLIGLPIINRNYEKIIESIKTLPYRTYCIQFYNFSSILPLGILFERNFYNTMNNATMNNATTKNSNTISSINNTYTNKYNSKKPTSNAIFNIKADLYPDIYYLYCKDVETSYGTAIIPTYKSSVLLNSLFRNIKENNNLDLLEESDDEDEFEDIRENKFVDLDKTIKMKCVYNRKFKKWQPIEIIKESELVDLVTYKNAKLME